MEERWIEIKFYLYCKDLTKLCGDMYNALEFIDGLAASLAFSALPIKNYFNRILQVPPSREEIVYLAILNKMSYREIRAITGCHFNMIYAIMKTENRKSQVFEPLFILGAHKHMTSFLNFFQELKKVGKCI